MFHYLSTPAIFFFLGIFSGIAKHAEADCSHVLKFQPEESFPKLKILTSSIPVPIHALIPYVSLTFLLTI
ncbi:unnamed protein product [Coffea canephora]|uniref:Uncharacterized protein n=1 Tax=Coffea canephora TaxID=49390 RepID=A0A068UWF8_COFCA|nr:unnamed protein product [Coffea canephora]